MKFVFVRAAPIAPAAERLGLPLRRRDDQRLLAVSMGPWRGMLALRADEKPLVFEAKDGNRLFVAGAPTISRGSLHEMLRRAAEASASAAASSLATLDGAFCAVHYDDKSGDFTIIADRLGLSPVYACRTEAGWAFASRADAAASALGLKASPDPVGWAAFLRIGHAVGEATLTQGVRRLPAAALWRVDAEGGVHRAQHWRCPPAEDEGATDLRARVAALAQAVEAEARAYHETYGEALLLLSGGFDSRFIAAALPHTGRHARAVAVAHPERGNADARLARALARSLGLPIEMRRLAEAEANLDSAACYIDDTELSNPSLGLFIGKVATLIRAEKPHAVWDGLALGWSMAGFYHPAATVADFFQRLETQARDDRMSHALWHAAQTLFSAPLRSALQDGWRALRAESEAGYSSSAEGLQHFLIEGRLRRRVSVHTLQALSEDAIPFTPGLGRAYLDNVLRLPLALRLANAPYRTLYSDVYPEAARIPILSGMEFYRLREGVDLRARYEEIRADLLGHWRVQALRARFRGRRRAPLAAWLGSDAALSLCDDSALDADAVRALVQNAGTASTARSAELLFYWSRYRAMFENAAVQARPVAFARRS